MFDDLNPRFSYSIVLIKKRDLHYFFLKETFYKNIEAQIWCIIFPKTTKNSKFERGNFANESSDKEKHFKHVFQVGVGWELEKIRIKIKNILSLGRQLLVLIKKCVFHKKHAPKDPSKHSNKHIYNKISMDKKCISSSDYVISRLYWRNFNSVDRIFSICASIRRSNWDGEIRGQLIRPSTFSRVYTVRQKNVLDELIV